MHNHREIYDISIPLGKSTAVYPGDVPFSRTMDETIESGGSCNLSSFAMSAHAGTHIDVPAHFIVNGASLDRYTAGDFILPAVVAPIANRRVIGRDDLAECTIGQGEALLFKTRNSEESILAEPVFRRDYVYLSREAARFCVEKKVGLVGIDSWSVDPFDDTVNKAHHELLQNGVLILESIMLKEVPPGRYTLLCLPLKIVGGEASPVRAVLLR